MECYCDCVLPNFNPDYCKGCSKGISNWETEEQEDKFKYVISKED